jgi:hypothetical protein
VECESRRRGHPVIVPFLSEILNAARSKARQSLSYTKRATKERIFQLDELCGALCGMHYRLRITISPVEKDTITRKRQKRDVFST